MTRVLFPTLLVLSACSATAEVGSCQVSTADDGTTTISCPDGSTATVTPGHDGNDGSDAEVPGVSGTVEGFVRIDNSLDVAALAHVTKITGSLVLNSTMLTSLSLPKLEEVGGSLIIIQNLDITTISLPSLKHVGVGVHVGRNLALTSVALPALQTIGTAPARLLRQGEPPTTYADPPQDLDIDSNPALADLDVGSLSRITGSLKLTELDTLSSLSTFSKLEWVGDTVVIEKLPLLTSLDGFEALTYIEDDLVIEYNDLLTSLDGLKNLVSLGDQLIVCGNTALDSTAFDTLVTQLENQGWDTSGKYYNAATCL